VYSSQGAGAVPGLGPVLGSTARYMFSTYFQALWSLSLSLYLSPQVAVYEHQQALSP
jgi:hypothetical protein